MIIIILSTCRYIDGVSHTVLIPGTKNDLNVCNNTLYYKYNNVIILVMCLRIKVHFYFRVPTHFYKNINISKSVCFRHMRTFFVLMWDLADITKTSQWLLFAFGWGRVTTSQVCAEFYYFSVVLKILAVIYVLYLALQYLKHILKDLFICPNFVVPTVT